MYIYKVIKENLQNCEFGSYVAYGIACKFVNEIQKIRGSW